MEADVFNAKLNVARVFWGRLRDSLGRRLQLSPRESEADWRNPKIGEIERYF
jgi:hypothetical protein